MADQATETTTIQVHVPTYQRLNGRKRPGDDFNDAIVRALDDVDELREDRDRLERRVEELQAELLETESYARKLEARLEEADEPPHAVRESEQEARRASAPDHTGEDTEPDHAAPDGPVSDESLLVAIDELDVPGSGDLAERRRLVIEDVVAHIRKHGSASRSELLEDVVDADRAGYVDGTSAWKNLVQPALQELADDHERLRSPGEGGHRWRWVDSSEN